MSKIDREKKTIAVMTHIYCKDHHQTTDTLCKDCQLLLKYAHRRLDTCPFQEKKPACNHCTVHCYSANKREKVKQVMRYAGPRMAYKHPIMSIQHLFDKIGEPPKLKK